MRLGISVKSLEPSQLSFYIIESLNGFQKTEHDAIVFYQDWSITFGLPKFAMLQEKEIWQFDGVVISTDLSTTKCLLKCPGPIRKYFYVWDLEWKNTALSHDELLSIYTNPSISLIARSNNHAKLIGDLWKKPDLIIEDFDFNKLGDLL